MLSNRAQQAKAICLVARVSVAPRPDIVNCAKVLAQHGWSVDVLAAEDAPLPEYKFPEPTIRITRWQEPLGDTWPARRFRSLFSFVRWVVRGVRCKDYTCCVGFDADGLIAAWFASMISSRVPVLYYSLELYPSADLNRLDQKIKKFIERIASQRALATITHDARRAAVLVADNHLDRDRVYLVPNAPLAGSEPLEKSDYLPKLLAQQGLTGKRTIVLYQGGLGDLTMVRELAESVAKWPADCVLVLHGWGDPNYIDQLRQVAAHYKPPRVFIHTDFLSYEDLDALTSSADIGVALYRNAGRNVYEMASGKIFQYLKAGLPVVTVNFPNLRAVIESNEAGICIPADQPQMVAEALRRIIGSEETYARFSRNARRAFQEKYAYERNFRPILDLLEDLSSKRARRMS